MKKLASKYSTIIIGAIILATGLALYSNANFFIYEIVDYSTKPATPQDTDKPDYDFLFAWADILFLILLPYLVILTGIIVIIVGGIKFIQKSIIKKRPQIEKQPTQFEEKRPKWLRNLIYISFIPIIMETIFAIIGISYLSKNTIDVFIIGESNTFDAISIVSISLWSVIAYQLIRGTWKVRTSVVILLLFDVFLSAIYLIKGNWYAAGSILINSVIVYYLFRPKVIQYFDSKTTEKESHNP